MKHMAAYLLVTLSGATPTADSVSKVITAAGGEVDEASLATMMTELEGANVEELLVAGQEKLSKVSVGGGGGGAAAGGDAPAAAVKEVVEEEEVDMGGNMDMFGGDADAGGGDY